MELAEGQLELGPGSTKKVCPGDVTEEAKVLVRGRGAGGGERGGGRGMGGGEGRLWGVRDLLLQLPGVW